jgi:hypothetical protein
MVIENRMLGALLLGVFSALFVAAAIAIAVLN